MADAEAAQPEVDSEEDDGDYVPVDDDEDAAQDDAYEALHGGEDPDDPDCPKGARRRGGSPNKGKRKADAAPPGAKRARRAGGICLSDDEEEASAPGAQAEPDGEAAEGEDAEPPAPETRAHPSGGAAQEDAKPKPKSAMDDLWEEMKRGESTKKPAPAPKTDIGSFINGLVSQSSAAGGAAASKGAGAKFDVASLFPTSVTKKQTIKVEEKVDFAGQQVKIAKEVEVGSQEHAALQKKKTSKGNLDDLVARLTGKQKSITTLTKTEHDWGSFKKEKGLEDELATYRKNGYLEKVAFLKKTDDHLEAELREQRQKERDARAKAQHASDLAAGPGL